MRNLILLALVALAVPLSAHDHWRDHRPVVVVETPWRPAHRFDERRWDDRWEAPRWERHAWARRHDCEDRLVFRPRPRPLAPYRERVELWVR